MLRRDPYIVVAVLALFLQGCAVDAGDQEIRPTITSIPTTSSEPAGVDLVADHVSSWEPLSSATFRPPEDGTEKHEVKDLTPMIQTIFATARHQAESPEVLHAASSEDMYEAIESAMPPGLRESVASKIEEREDDADDIDFTWAQYGTRLDDQYTVTDQSKFTYAWKLEDTEIDGQPLVAVTIFTRTLYELESDGGAKELLPVARWFSLAATHDSVANPATYGWNTDFQAPYVDACRFLNDRVFSPSLEENWPTGDSDLKFFEADASEYVETDEYEYVDEDSHVTKDLAAECSTPAATES